MELLLEGRVNGAMVNGNWGSWLSWNTCSVTCGGGVRNRTRNCDNPPPDDNGDACVGDSLEIGECFTQNCPISKPFLFCINRTFL